MDRAERFWQLGDEPSRHHPRVHPDLLVGSAGNHVPG
jgi:hypothetical protein